MHPYKFRLVVSLSDKIRQAVSDAIRHPGKLIAAKADVKRKKLGI
jgi:hypothetical protein